jgi:hypothetical protein
MRGTGMRVGEYFKQVRREQAEIKRLKESIERLNASLLPQGIRYDKDKVQTTPQDVLSATVAEIAEQTARLDILVLKLSKRRELADALVNDLDKSEEREVMRLYYLDPRLLSWEEVAKLTNYSERSVFLYRESAMRKISKVCSILQL